MHEEYIDLTDEENVIKLISKKMENMGIKITYKAIKEKKHVSRKPDIRGWDKNKCRIWIVEVKPQIRPTAKKPFHQRRNYFDSLICQIVTRMKSKNTNYAIGIPYTMYKQVIDNIPLEARKRLKLRLFIVKKNGKVDYKSYTDW